MIGLRILWLRFRLDWLDASIVVWLAEVRLASDKRERLIAKIEELRKRQDRKRTLRVINEIAARSSPETRALSHVVQTRHFGDTN